MLKIVIYSIILGLLFTALIYNINIIPYLGFISDIKILTLILISLFNFSLYLYFSAKFNINPVLLIAIVCIPPILIDSSILITYMGLFPLRFPFASIFPILGATCGYIYLYKKSYVFFSSFVFIIIFCLLSNYYIIPRIIFYIETKAEVPNISNSIFLEEFKDIDGKLVKLADTAQSKCNLLEMFFVGCAPCEEKKITLMRLNNFPKAQLHLIFICNGAYTSYNNFLKYVTLNKTDNVTYLYDVDGTVLKKNGLLTFPFELLAEKNKIISKHIGFNKESADLYYNNEIKKINNIINN